MSETMHPTSIRIPKSLFDRVIELKGRATYKPLNMTDWIIQAMAEKVQRDDHTTKRTRERGTR